MVVHAAAAHSTQEPDIADRTLIEIGIELIVIGVALEKTRPDFPW